MNSMIQNYINGNLTTARGQAAHRSFASILTALRDYGFGAESSIAIASYLKGLGTFQQACDAEFAERSAQ